jgi:hypothetical protein
MIGGGQPRTSVTYTSLIAAYANAAPADPSGAESVLRRMEADYVEPNVITCVSHYACYLLSSLWPVSGWLAGWLAGWRAAAAGAICALAPTALLSGDVS